ncbi:hypothetical protein Ciccas_012599, partial [Cichlidogyrus casuarinus]
DAERCLGHHRQCLEEIEAYHKDADKLLMEGRGYASSQLDSLHGVILGQRLDQISENWKAVLKIAAAREILLTQRLNMEQFLRDHAYLDVKLDQHLTFVNSHSKPISLDAALEQRNQMLNFVESFKIDMGKIASTLQNGRNMVQESVKMYLPPNRYESIIEKCDALANKSNEISNISEERMQDLEELVTKFEFLEHIDEFSEWVNDRRNWVEKSRIKIENRSNNPESLELRFKILEREIQNNAFKLDELKQASFSYKNFSSQKCNEKGEFRAARAVAKNYPGLKETLDKRTEDVLHNWDDFLDLLRSDWQALAETVRESDFNDFIYSILRLNRKVDQAVANLPSLQNPDASLSAALLQSDLNQLEKLSKECEHLSERVPFWRSGSEKLSATFPEKATDFRLRLDNAETELKSRIAQIGKLDLELKNFLELARLRVEVKLEIVYAQDKMLELDTLVRKRNVSGFRKPATEPGQMLHVAKQKRAALKNHLLEIENRRPRMIHCSKVRDD